MGNDNCPDEKNQRGKMVTGIILTGIGVLFLLHNFDILFIHESWPFILIVIGLAMLIGAMFRKKDSESGEIPKVQEPHTP